MSKPIYDDIRERIVSGKLAAGEALTELTLATHYGVSRTPIREALHQLEHDGFVEREGKGLIVSTRTAEEVLELYEFRALLEEAAAMWAAARRTELDVGRLIFLQEEMKDKRKSSVASRVDANKAFHQQLWKASHNSRLMSALEHIYNQLHRYPEITIEVPGRWEEVLAEHDELLDAISAGDVERSVAAARKHIEGARNVRLKILSSGKAT